MEIGAIIIFAMIFGWGNGGWGGFGGAGNGAVQGSLTRGDLCSEFSFNDLQNGVRNVNDSVNLGFSNLNSTICHQQYDTAMLVNGVTGAVNDGFARLNSTICQQQYDTAGMLNAMNMTNMQNANAANIVALQNQNALQTQIADCCCQTQRALDGINYNMATNTCALQNTIQTGFRDSIDATNAGTRAILDFLCQEKISDLQNENQSLKLAASQAAQNTLLTNAMSAQTAQLINRIAPYPTPSYLVSPPYAVPYGYNYGANNNFGCGCGCGCN